MLVAAGVVLFWLLDNVFNGVLQDYFVSFITGYDQTLDMVRLNKDKLASLAFAAIIALSLLLSGTGAFCAYLANRKQKARLLRAQEEARRAQALAETEMQRKSDLITYLAHDLKTPLASVIAYLSLLDEAPEIATDLRAKYTGIALEKAYRLERLVSELFEIIRFNLQTIELNREKIPLKRMLEQLADEFYPLLLETGKRVTIECDGDIALNGDPDKLARVFNNLLRNASAYGRENSEIRIRALREPKALLIRFQNEGDPIPKEQANRIFEKFYRLDSSRSSLSGGAGLGLAIAREIVQAHGGEISVESDEKHTVFQVRLPNRPRE